MSEKMYTDDDVRTLWRCAREHNSTISDEALDAMRADLLAREQEAQPVAYMVMQKNRLSVGAMYRSEWEAKADGLADWEIDEVVPLYEHLGVNTQPAPDDAHN